MLEIYLELGSCDLEFGSCDLKSGPYPNSSLVNASGNNWPEDLMI